MMKTIVNASDQPTYPLLYDNTPDPVDFCKSSLFRLTQYMTYVMMTVTETTQDLEPRLWLLVQSRH